MKKLFKILIIFLFTLLLTSCINSKSTPILEVFYINDLHGSILESNEEMGLAKIGNLIVETKKTNPNTIFLAGGDMFQGSAISNYYFGEPVIEILDHMEIDANILGNHEFDWGIDKITNYYGDNKLAKHPLLSLNTFYKITTNLIEDIDPYKIISLPDFRVGVIGYIDDLRSSIMASMIEPYVFANPLTYIKDTAKYLREVEKCNFIIVAGHSANRTLTESMRSYEIDLYLEAHSHMPYINTLSNGKIVAQAGSNGKFVFHATYDKNLNNLSKILLNKENEPLLNKTNSDIESILNKYILLTEDIFKKPIITNGSKLISKTSLTIWAAKVISAYYNADIGFHNSGGTRDVILANEVINFELIYKIFPFDNLVLHVKLNEKQMREAYNSSYYTKSNNLNIEDKDYYVAVNQYIYEESRNIFLSGILLDGSILMRDIILQELELQSLVYSYFSVDNEILIGNKDLT